MKANIIARDRGSVTIKGRDIISYLNLRKKGYTTLWSGEGMICLRKPKRHAKHS